MTSGGAHFESGPDRKNNIRKENILRRAKRLGSDEIAAIADQDARQRRLRETMDRACRELGGA